MSTNSERPLRIGESEVGSENSKRLATYHDRVTPAASVERIHLDRPAALRYSWMGIRCFVRH
jgi:hypothetical protein